LINYDGGVSDQLGLTEEYRTRTRLGAPDLPPNSQQQHAVKCQTPSKRRTDWRTDCPSVSQMEFKTNGRTDGKTPGIEFGAF